jgi:uncharacterized membrane protein
LQSSSSSIARTLILGGGAVAYALLAHLSNSRPGHADLGLLLGLAPLWLVAVALAWRSRVRVPALLACAAITLLLAVRWQELKSHFSWTYLLQQVGTYALLGWGFGRTLAPGRVPLCAQFAARVHGTLDATTAQYTRSITLAWTVFFGVIAAVLLVLYFVAPLPVWSLFANFCTLPLVLLMFAIENLVRRRALPGLAHVGVVATIRAVARRAPHESA